MWYQDRFNDIAKARERLLEARRNREEKDTASFVARLDWLEARERYDFTQLVAWEATGPEGQAEEEYHELVPRPEERRQVELVAHDEEAEDDDDDDDDDE